VFHENLIIDLNFSLSKFSAMNSFVFGSAGYPEPKSIFASNLNLYISSSRLSFARIDAAETTGWLKSALCSHESEIISGFLISCWTSFDQDSMFVEGQSTITVTFSFRSSVSLLIIFAVLIASR